ncbi:MAG: hypothetical protein HYU88_08300, partial [Chloroflexi bacterium]|nr:hypothetical protein [Chloroflexota bacterium]
QKAMLEAAAEAKAWNRQASTKLLAEVIKEVTGHGMTIYTPTPQEYAQWSAIREQVWKEVAEQQKGKLDLNQANELYRAYN